MKVKKFDRSKSWVDILAETFTTVADLRKKNAVTPVLAEKQRRLQRFSDI